MINVALIGAGAHSAGNHGPALQRYAARHPGRICLAAVCDLDADRARRAQAQFGFIRNATSIDALFAPGADRLDALVVIFSIPAMLAATPPLFARGLPLLIEKPLGNNLTEAEALGQAAQRAGAAGRIMVSFNRRHDPALIRARDWLRAQPPFRYIRAAMYRCARTEPDFGWGTGVHLLDALESLAGPLQVRPDGVLCPGRAPPDAARVALLRGRSGADVLFEMLPTAGEPEESIRIVGDDYQVDIRTGAVPPWRVRAVKHMQAVFDALGPADEPPFVRNGTYAETAAFLDAVSAGRSLPPATLADALASSRLAARIENLLK
jgi:predicted dehydrogenase